MAEKGKTNNPDGRPKGVGNKVTTELRERIKLFLDEKYEDFNAAFDSLDAMEKTKLYVSMLKYSVPIMQAVKQEIDFNDLKEWQLSYLIECLKTQKQPTVEGLLQAKGGA